MGERDLVLRPIGFVENGIERRPPGGWAGVRSIIRILPEYHDALLRIEDQRYLQVIFWFHRREKESREVTRVHPMRRKDIPLHGVFATRSPTRPNPLGMTTVRLLEASRGTLYVRGLDALHGTPIVDIKSDADGDGPRRNRAP